MRRSDAILRRYPLQRSEPATDSRLLCVELERLHEFLDGLLALLAAVLEHVGDMRAQVVLEQQAVQRFQRLLDGTGLRDDVHAVLLVLDHPRDAAQLTLEDARAMQRPLLDVFDHS